MCADPGKETFSTFRISENCGKGYPNACEVDMLYNHDAGDLLADVDFITAGVSM